MSLFALEHSKAAYSADFAIYGVAVVVLAAFLLTAGPRDLRLEIAALAWVGLVSWTAIEYGLHRFVLHRLRPFSRWHAEHHERPTARICAPTLLSATLIVALIFLPALTLGNLWSACALTFGVLSGYLAFSVTHHATHHWCADSAWLKQRKRWHALHHQAVEQSGCYGVTSSFWDHVFGSTRSQSAQGGRSKKKEMKARQA